MSYSIIRMQKIKFGGVRGIQNHDQRLKESHTNNDIDKSKTELNEDIGKEYSRTYYVRIKNRIDELNLPKALRKDAVVMCEFIATSDKAYFNNMPQNEQKRFFEEARNFIADRYGEENVIHATVHYDESTPHLHMGIVPVTKDNTLSCYKIFDKVELRSLQQDFNKHMNNKGFELEKGESREDKKEHLDTQRFKAETIKGKINDLEQARDIYRGDLNALQDEIKGVQAVAATFSEIDAIEGKTVLFSKAKVTVDAGEFEKLKSIAKKQHILEDKAERLEKENHNLRSDMGKSVKMKMKNIKDKNGLEQENSKLRRGVLHLYKFIDKMGLKDKADDYIKKQGELEKQQLKANTKSIGRDR